VSWVFRHVRKRTEYFGDLWLEHLSRQRAPDDDLKLDDDGNLSAWWIDDAETNLNRVIAALASARQHPAVFDYVLLDSKNIESLERDSPST
jgi:hypothetical protein